MSRQKSLAELGLTAKGAAQVVINGIEVDSRKVGPGMMFAALPGSHVHGARYAEVALAQGAVALLTDPEGAEIAAEAIARYQPAVVVAQNVREAFSGAAALWWGAQPQVMVAVTGTNGKTSVSTFARQLWQALGHPAINIGTTGVEGDWSAPSPHTTPEPLTLHRILAEAAEAGITHAAMEASSHGLDQRRLDGVRLRAAGFTNFTQDHLDYHQSFEAYFAAKAGLFNRVLPDDAAAVINIDDPKGYEMALIAEGLGQNVMAVGRSEEASLRILGQRFDATGQELRLSWAGQTFQTRLNLVGGFQAENALLAAGLVIAAGEVPGRVLAALGQLSGVRGRMELAATRQNGAAVYVDYAHTPDAIATALKALRPHVMGRVVIVFGAGGDRDRTKRPLMGAAAAAHADLVFVTDDNPRSEDPATIRAEIMAACPNAIEVGDRAEAILRAVASLEAGDTLLIAGKGHESGQTIQGQTYPFDDLEQASVAVAALDGLI